MWQQECKLILANIFDMLSDLNGSTPCQVLCSIQPFWYFNQEANLISIIGVIKLWLTVGTTIGMLSKPLN